MLIKIRTFSFKKVRLKMWTAKWWAFCPGEDELTFNPCRWWSGSLVKLHVNRLKNGFSYAKGRVLWIIWCSSLFIMGTRISLCCIEHDSNDGKLEFRHQTHSNTAYLARGGGLLARSCVWTRSGMSPRWAPSWPHELCYLGCDVT